MSALRWPWVKAVLEEVVNQGSGWEESALMVALRTHIDQHWNSFALSLSVEQVDHLLDTTLLRSFPRLRAEPTLFGLLAQSLGRSEHLYASHTESFLKLVDIRSRDAVRLLVEALRERRRAGLDSAEAWPVLLWPALGRGAGWDTWTQLFGILIAMPEYAGLDVIVPPPATAEGQSTHLTSSKVQLAQHLSRAEKVRGLAGHLQHLFKGEQAAKLIDRPAETRSAFVARLQQLIGRDAQLRQAAVEALLWLADGQAAELALFAATRLVQPADRKLLKELSLHPNALTGYGADAVEQIVFGDGLSGMRIEPTARHGIASAAQPLAPTRIADEEPRTWLGDRAIERAIEAVVDREERRFATEYPRHHSEGEERLCAILFEALSKEFAILSRGWETAARLAGSPRAANVQLRYRSVDKPEEGSKGVKGAKRFSTDVCLIVDPMLDGRSLGRRASLLQAKRLYRDGRRRSSSAWEASYRLKPKQTAELIQQTESSFFMFQGPGLNGRGLPIIPARLVSDLALHQSASGAQLAAARVGTAARPLADWLTYSLLGLRVGDPYEELVERAEGGRGRFARRLLELPRVEVAVAVGPVERRR
ncbi:MAG TPA: hypothetical protein VEZ20_03330 [Allosphingosinicella sp.]|nr:hypothetical protein [Allosphingosinicella sp.]